MAHGGVGRLASRFDAKQIICTVIGGVFGVGLIFLVGIHIGKQVGGRLPGDTSEDGATAVSERPSATLSRDSSAVAGQQSGGEEDYRFFALLDAPAPTRELPELELSMNPVLEERQNRKKKKEEATAAKASASAQAPASTAEKSKPAERVAEKSQQASARRERSKPEAEEAPREVAAEVREVADAPLVAAGVAADETPPDVERLLAVAPAVAPRERSVSEPKPAAAKKVVAEAAPEEATSEEAPSARKSKEKSSSAGRFTVQVSAFQDKAVADALAEDFRRRGHKVHVKHEEIPGRGSWYRVQVGRLDSRDEAASLRARIKQSDGYDGFVTSM